MWGLAPRPFLFAAQAKGPYSSTRLTPEFCFGHWWVLCCRLAASCLPHSPRPRPADALLSTCSARLTPPASMLAPPLGQTSARLTCPPEPTARVTMPRRTAASACHVHPAPLGTAAPGLCPGSLVQTHPRHAHFQPLNPPGTPRAPCRRAPPNLQHSPHTYWCTAPLHSGTPSAAAPLKPPWTHTWCWAASLWAQSSGGRPTAAGGRRVVQGRAAAPPLRPASRPARPFASATCRPDHFTDLIRRSGDLVIW